ncbi:hypothetical protein HY643_00385 [Candidatus Woesearchaeota archaeon]|nr:hypothetical protein [Candidatus Woesearchaeota archaeon]
MDLGIFTTSYCANNCVLCCVQGEVKFGFHHLGKSEEEVKGLENLIKISRGIHLTGGDPLMNPTFLKLITQHKYATKTIVINPLTFLTSIIHKPAKKITNEEASNFISQAEKDGLPEQLEDLCSNLSNFECIAVSSGNLQGPNPEIIGLAKEFFNKTILPKIKANLSETRRRLGKHPFVKYQEVNGEFKNEQLVDVEIFLRTPMVSCTGKLRMLVEKNELKQTIFEKNPKIEYKYFACETTPNYTIYFKKEDNQTRMYITSCCKVGVTPYTSYKTSLTLEKIACMQPKEVSRLFKNELEKRKETAVYHLLNNPVQTEKFNNKSVTIDSFNYEIPFNSYIAAAEQLIREKTGKTVSMKQETYSTKGSEAKCCACCYTTGLMLQRAGISPEEWQSHLEKNFKELK